MQKCSATTNAENTLDLHSNYLLAFLHTHRGVSLTHTHKRKIPKFSTFNFLDTNKQKKPHPLKYTI